MCTLQKAALSSSGGAGGGGGEYAFVTVRQVVCQSCWASVSGVRHSLHSSVPLWCE